MALTLAAIPARAIAQSAAPPAAEPPPAPTAQAPPAPSPEATEAARHLFSEGARLLHIGRFEEARDRFLRALAVRPSPLLRFNLALASQNSGHFVEAIDQYRQFLLDDTDPANAVRRQEAQRAIEGIDSILGRLIITTAPGSATPTEARLDGHVLPLALLGVDVPVDPTQHTIELFGANGAHATMQVRLHDATEVTVTIALHAPPSPPPGASSASGASASPGPNATPHETATSGAQQAQAASTGSVSRVRRIIEAHAATPDEFGQRRWERTIVFYAFQGMGNPNGLLGVGMRWAARPWVSFELQGGGGHPFGPGIGLFASAGAPFSYRYGLSLLVGVSTNLTQIQEGTAMPGQTCQPSSSFTPVWLTSAIAHEWRVSTGFAFRFALGIRYLVNNRELGNALEVHCAQTQPFSMPNDLFFDAPTTERTVPVLPFLMFDVGYAL